MLGLVLLVQAAATWALVGLIWTIQVVHYPLFDGVHPARYAAWQRRHMTRITIVVAPLMLAEALTAALALFLVLTRGPTDLVAVSLLGVVLLAAIWLSTAFVQAPLHGRLTEGFDASRHRRLVRSNWTRTALWTVRGALLLGVLASQLELRP